MQEYLGEALVIVAVVAAMWRISRDVRHNRNGLTPEVLADLLHREVSQALPDPSEAPLPLNEELESLKRRMDALGQHVDERLAKLSGIWGQIQKARRQEAQNDEEAELTPEEAQALLDHSSRTSYSTGEPRRLTLAEIEALAARGD